MTADLTPGHGGNAGDMSGENDAPTPGRLFEHLIYTTGYQREDGPEPIAFEITEVTDDGKVYYGPAQRGMETAATLWIWEHLFTRDALGSWVGTTRPIHGGDPR